MQCVNYFLQLSDIPQPNCLQKTTESCHYPGRRTSPIHRLVPGYFLRGGKASFFSGASQDLNPVWLIPLLVDQPQQRNLTIHSFQLFTEASRLFGPALTCRRTICKFSRIILATSSSKIIFTITSLPQKIPFVQESTNGSGNLRL